MTLAGLAATVLAAATLALNAVHLAFPQRDGVLAISQVFAPHLQVALLVAALLLLVAARRRRVPAVVVGLSLAVAAARFVPGMVALPAAPAADETALRVAAWNLAAGDATPQLLVQRLLESDAEIVALPELQPGHVAAMEASSQLTGRFPHRALRPHATVLGMGVLSAYPLVERSAGTDPPHILADVSLPDGRTVVTLAGHPLPARFRLVADWLPIAYQAGKRDADLALLRDLVEIDLVAGRPVLLLGDFNVTDREPAYGTLTDGLRDGHREAGLGPGSTWRPPQWAGLPVGILRIDYVLVGGPLRTVAISAECLVDAGDHCIVWATLALDRGP